MLLQQVRLRSNQGCYESSENENAWSLVQRAWVDLRSSHCTFRVFLFCLITDPVA